MIFRCPGSLFGAKSLSKMGSESHRRRGRRQEASWKPPGALLERFGAEKHNWDRILGGQERFQYYFFRLQEAPRALQEASKRLSEGFRVDDAIRTPFWTHLLLTQENLRP